MHHITRLFLAPQDWFASLDQANGDEAKWFRGVKRNMERQINAAEICCDEKLDNSANELYHSHIKEMSAAFARANDKEGLRGSWPSRLCDTHAGARASQASSLIQA